MTNPSKAQDYPPWFVAVKFWSDPLYKWVREIPGVYWDKKLKVLLVPVDVLSLLQSKATELGVSLAYPNGKPSSSVVVVAKNG